MATAGVQKGRSDLHVTFELAARGGVELSLESKVAPYYGDSIREQVFHVCAALGVEHARVEVQDGGALPFTIAARLEAAALRAGVEGGDGRPEGREPPEPSARGRLRRSRLYLPGNGPKVFVNAGLHGGDGIILDLEDSVHADEKDTARLLVRNALRCLDFGAAERMVRINQLPLGLTDLDAVVPERPDLILIPKVEDPDQVRQVADRITSIPGGGNRPLWLMPILESALGVEHAFSIATASERVAALTIGLEDYTADLGVRKTVEGSESRYARERLVNAAKAAGVQAIDSVYGDVGDMDGLRAWAERSRAMGYEGMGCIHPRQIPVIHEAFAPGRAEIDRALKIVAAFEEAEKKGLAVVSLGTKMVDPPVVNRALKLVGLARAQGLLEEATP